jgi:hypothetical protein
MSYISSCLASFFQDFLLGVVYNCDDEVKIIDSEHSLHLSQGGSGFLREEGFVGETFLFFKGSASSLGGVTFPFFFSSSFPFISSTSSSPPRSGDTEVVFYDALLKSWTSSVFFLLLVLGVSCSL